MDYTRASSSDAHDSDTSFEDDSSTYEKSTVLTLTFLANGHSVFPNPRLAMVFFGQAPSARQISDDQGIDLLGFPKEIRNDIYRCISAKSSNIGGQSKFTKPFYRDALTMRSLDFAGSCRQIWNESLRIYLLRNGFEFFFIRPMLEFLEKIGIRGRRLIPELRIHHHKRSNPFIVLRLLRSCENLRELEIYARVTVKWRKNFWWGVPLLDAKRYFMTKYSTIDFGTPKAFGSDAKASDIPPNLTRK